MKKLIGAIVVIAVILAILQAIVESPVVSAICIVLIVAALVFFGLKIWKKIQAKKKQSGIVEAKTIEEEKPIDFALAVNACDYSYFDVGLYQPKGVCVMPNIGDAVLFVEEPDNPYDENAVYGSVNGQNIGYLNKGKIRDFIVDTIHSDTWIYIAGVTRADDKVEVCIGIDK